MYVQLIALTLALVALGVFAVRGASPAGGINPRSANHDSSPFLGRFLVAYAYWLLSPVAELAASLKLSPNVSSWACLMLGICSGIAAGLGAALFDMLVGMLARSQGRASEAGEVLDAAVYRYAEFCFLTGLCFYYRHAPWAMVLVQAALLGSMLVSYSQAKAEAMHVDVPRGWMRRPERAAYLGSGAFLSPIVTVWLEAGDPLPLHYPLLFAALFVAVFANATAIRRFIVLYAMAKARR